VIDGFNARCYFLFLRGKESESLHRFNYFTIHLRFCCMVNSSALMWFVRKPEIQVDGEDTFTTTTPTSYMTESQSSINILF
jgi:hypothetical protein